MTTDEAKILETLTREIADHLQSMLDEGLNPGHVADAAMAAGAALRLQVTGPASLVAMLATLARRAAADAAAPGTGRVN